MLRTTLRASVSIAAIVGVAACQNASPAGPAHARHPVLFVGNSLTYVNDLPSTVAAIAAAVGDTIFVGSATAPNLALIDHLNGGTDAVARIAQGGWEYVVLQQGPTTIGICRDSLVLWTHMFDERIRAIGAHTALFMVWPTSDQPERFDLVRQAFQTAAQSVNGVFLPAGEAWRAAWRRDASLPLYGADGFHPSAMGSYLAALEIYERISGRDARTFPPQAFAAGQPFPLPEATVRLLQEAAHEANQNYHSLARRQATQPSQREMLPGGHC